MKIPSEHEAIENVAARLAELLGMDRERVRRARLTKRKGIRSDDVVLRAGSLTFAVAWKNSGTIGPVTAAVEHLRGRSADYASSAVPLVTVPFMGNAARALCDEAGVPWLDLSGNARLLAPGVRILVEGKPNLYRRRGRPSTAFAPKSSRVARWLLMHPGRAFAQREIARAAGVDEGQVSRIVAKLEDDGLIVRDGHGAVSPRDPDLLLDAWREKYDFSKHRRIQGHVAARSGTALLRQLAGVLEDLSVSYAATGLAAAWLLDRFAEFRIVSVYLAAEPTVELISALSFREDARGANTWLLVPSDDGVFHGSESHDGIRCVHPVQAWLDLLAHPERAGDAARRLRDRHLTWRAYD
jgi:hypothetical protein